MDEKTQIKKPDEPAFGKRSLIDVVIFVVIVIVMAGILYFPFPPNDDFHQQPPTGSITINITSNQSAEIIFGAFSYTSRLDALRFILSEYNDSYQREIIFHIGNQNLTSTNQLISSVSSLSAIYFDYYPLSNDINSGDYINITGLTPNISYQFYVFHCQRDDFCHLFGNTTFTMPP